MGIVCSICLFPGICCRPFFLSECHCKGRVEQGNDMFVPFAWMLWGRKWEVQSPDKTDVRAPKPSKTMCGSNVFFEFGLIFS